MVIYKFSKTYNRIILLTPTLVIAILSLLILSSCQNFKNPEFKEVKDFKIKKIGFGENIFSLNAIMNNPNKIGLQLKSTELDFYVDGNLLAHSTQEHQIRINSNENFEIPLNISAQASDLLSKGLNLIGAKEINLKVKGFVKISKAGIPIKIPIDYEGKQKVSGF